MKALIKRKFYGGWGSWCYESAIVDIELKEDGTILYPKPSPLRGYDSAEIVRVLDKEIENE